MTQITNGGLCREYRERYSYDPIAFIEATKANAPVPTVASHDSAPRQEAVSERQVAQVQPATPTVSAQSTALSQQTLQLKALQVAKLTQPAINFLRDWEIKITANTSETMTLGQEGSISFVITKKQNNQPFEGELPASFTLLSSNSSIETDLSSVQYLQNGEQVVKFKTLKTGRATLAISFGGQTLALLSTQVQ